MRANELGERSVAPGGVVDEGAILAFRNVVKTFGPTVAVNDVSFSLQPGEIHALVGENGAGKSTLIRILAGDHQPDSGTITLDGVPVSFDHPGAALESGIGFVHQIPMFVPGLSITENLMLGVPFRRNAVGLIDWAKAHAAARQSLAQVGVDVDPKRSLNELGPAERQLVAVARALRRHPSVLVLDEVTASLTELEVRTVHRQIDRLRSQGIAVLYVSHRLEEIFRVADRVTVMRDGRHVTTLPVSDLTHQQLVNHIVGTKLGDLFVRHDPAPRTDDAVPTLEIDGLGDGKLIDLNLKLFPGEIVGIAGLGGSGRSRLLKMIYGFVTEDRIADGFVDTLPIWKNITLPWPKRFSSHGILKLRQERMYASHDATRIGVKMPSVDAMMTQLSGGNQQKAIFARWISAPIRLLLLDEPTHGVDIRSKAQIYDLIRELTSQGVGILLVSSEIEELVGLSDRVFILRDGRFRSVLRDEEITKDRILHSLLDEERQVSEHDKH